ncbi:DUF6126 family protein [Streptomyces sp. NPDC054765]
MPDQTTPATPATPATPVVPAAPAAPVVPSSSEPLPGAAPAARTYKEDKPPRGLYVRVFIYVVATHVLLAFMSFLVIVAKTR